MNIRSDRIKAMMQEDNITVAEFAEGIGKTKLTATAIAEGTIKMSKLNTFIDICDFFGCSADYLLGRSDARYYM